MLCQGTGKEIGSFVAVGLFVAYGSASTVVAGEAGNSVDFATMTETARGSENVSFADDVDTTARDEERIASWSELAGYLGRYSLY